MIVSSFGASLIASTASPTSQSAFLDPPAKKLDKFIERRQEIVAQYNAAFNEVAEITILQEKEWAKSVRHLYVIQLNLELLKAGRKIIFAELQKQGIGVQVHYIPLNLQPYYQKTFGCKPGDFPVAENYYQRAITLPLFPKMTPAEVKKVIATVKTIVQSYKK